FPAIVEQQMATGGFFIEAEGRRRDGTIFPTEASARMFEFEQRPLLVVSVRDMTDRRRREQDRLIMEKRLRQGQRVESLSMLASKLAHDFNNLLVGILGNASLGLMDVAPDDPIRVNLEEIERAAEEAAGLSRQLLAYAGGWKPRLVPVDLSEVISGQAELFQATLPERIRMIYRIEASLRPVMADPEQCVALVSHLCSNSLDAIGERSGMITVSLYGCEGLSENPQFVLMPETVCDQGPFVCLEIADSGKGMDATVLEKIFDPYFSTKANAAGMGLVAVIGIVRSHNAVLQVSSLPGQGTVFRIFFPYCVPEKPPAHIEPLAEPRHPGGAAHRVLIIDDDLWVRNVVSRTLTQAGYDCMKASDGPKGLEAARALLSELSLVVLDLHLPGLSGQEVFLQLRRMRPDLPVLISSGWSDTLDPFWEADVTPPADYLPKPYRPQQLLEYVSRILGMPEKE
ncbi:response regulator, partial [Myxococcota bacterium]|nr:response regulator [Myxococcota bacterium]